MSQPLLVIDVVGRPYGDVLELQRALVHRRLARELTEDLLLLVEHTDTYLTVLRSDRWWRSSKARAASACW